MLTPEQRQKLKQAGYNDLQIRVYESTRTSKQPEQKQKEPNVFQRVKNTITNAGQQAERAISGEGEFAGQSTLERATGAVGAAFGAVAKIPIDVSPKPVRQGFEKVGEGFQKLTDKIGGTQMFREAADSIDQNPNSWAAKVQGGLNVSKNLGDTAGGILTAQGAATTAQKGVDLTKQATRTVSNVATNVANKTEQAIIKPVQKASQKISQSTNSFVQEARRIPDRFKTNVANKQAAQQEINQLPSRIAREAAQDGLDVPDIKTLYRIPADQKTMLKKLAVNVKEFSEGKTKINPIEVVGKPIVNRLKELEAARGKVGAKLGEVAENLGVVTKEELTPTIFQRLKKVSGMEGLSIDDAGNLNFKNTVLATAETKADRIAIQRIFNSATKWGQGKNKHLLRQELFEALGGKKRAGINLTATQEKAYEAIRAGLSDVLESKNVGYKNLSNQYRQIVAPLKEMRKMMKVAGEADDILDMSAGLLARRLTSMAQSNPQIRAILNAMDKATKKAGKTRLSVESLQDFYNILEKYYDIAPKTGFQAQVRQGVEKAVGGPLNYIAEQIKGFAGETPAVRQKALEKILDEILR